VLRRISAGSLRGHLSFIASDLLEGRGTPSRGLDLAAEYIAAQFRRAGLEPVGDDGYYQTADMPETGQKGSGSATPIKHLPDADEAAVKVRNVIGLLRGSDAALANTYVLVTAHYDHLGMKPEGTGDRIYNGANDDGSGTVSVIEIASALASLQPRPRRSIVFMAFFGEEEGTLGSLYYARHPVFPIGETVADVNLEQVGRTDATDGRKISQATFTGYDYSDLPRVFRLAGARTGVRVHSDRPYGDSFFVRSDNAPLANQGVPAHTVAVAFDFADYHKVTDDWRKIDYDNMAKVDRMVALGIMMVADNPQPPRWNETDTKTEPYVKAWKEHHKQ
jgi:Zn-dependent M28 family amino/carboxypeptidase